MPTKQPVITRTLYVFMSGSTIYTLIRCQNICLKFVCVTPQSARTHLDVKFCKDMTKPYTVLQWPCTAKSQ